ncbi:MAG: hypothetical protein KBC73_04320 [Burkholderiaceae bacterium]|nr:hypothetical protein [Burkholderiaceae bacterium]
MPRQAPAAPRALHDLHEQDAVDSVLADGGRWRLQAPAGADELQLLATDRGQVLKRWPLPGGGELLASATRRSVVVAPAALPELWEISLDPHAEPQYEGLVHDFRMGEGLPVPGFLHLRRTRLPHPLAHITLDAAGLLLVGAAPGQPVLGYNLDARRRAAAWAVGGDPRPRAGTWCQRHGRAGLAVPDAARPLLHWLDADGQALQSLAVPAPLRWVRARPDGRLLAATAGALLQIDLEHGTVAAQHESS